MMTKKKQRLIKYQTWSRVEDSKCRRRMVRAQYINVIGPLLMPN